VTAPRLYKTEAIVLRQRKLGEADRILTLFSPTYGKLDAKAKGVRKTTSRMAGHLQPLNRCMVQLARGRTMEVIAGCETLESFQPLRDDLDRLSRALYAAELADRFLPERVENLSTYRLLLDTLHRLQSAASASGGDADPTAGSGRAPSTSSGLDLALRHYEMKLLERSGFQPELERCLGCQHPLPALPAGRQAVQNFFSPVAGGTYCASCGAGAVGSRALSVNGLKVLRLLQRASYKEVGGLNLPPALAQEVERHLRSYIVCVLERDVNAAAFVERLRREQQPLRV
jgi:DNA repair protein RecO (recombination protein O)